MAERASDPYQVLLKTNKLPMSLVRDGQGKNGIKEHQAKMQVEASPFGETFGPKATRKRVKLGVGSLEDLAGETMKMHDTYLDRLEQAKLLSGNSGADEPVGERAPEDADLATAREPIFSKGQSKRIWNELYKVIDSSDVVIHVLDARDPLGTRCRSVGKHIKRGFMATDPLADREIHPRRSTSQTSSICSEQMRSCANRSGRKFCIALLINCPLSPIPSLSQDSFQHLLHSPWMVVCYNFGISISNPPLRVS